MVCCLAPRRPLFSVMSREVAFSFRLRPCATFRSRSRECKFLILKKSRSVSKACNRRYHRIFFASKLESISSFLFFRLHLVCKLNCHCNNLDSRSVTGSVHEQIIYCQTDGHRCIIQLVEVVKNACQRAGIQLLINSSFPG